MITKEIGMPSGQFCREERLMCPFWQEPGPMMPFCRRFSLHLEHAKFFGTTFPDIPIFTSPKTAKCKHWLGLVK